MKRCVLGTEELPMSLVSHPRCALSLQFRYMGMNALRGCRVLVFLLEPDGCLP